MTDRKKMIDLVYGAHNAVTDKAIENHSTFGMSYAEQIETEADFLIANGVTVQRWIPVTERLPKKEGWYQVFTSPDKGHKSINKARYSLEPEWSVNAGKGRWNGSGGTWTNVTHWMPLPERPKEVE